MDGLDAGAHDLGDEGRGIGRQRQRQRHEFRNDARAAGKIEPLEDRHLKRYWCAKDQRGHQRQADQQAQRIRPNLDHSAAFEQRPAGITPQPNRRHDRNHDGNDERFEAGIADRFRNHQSTIREKETVEYRDALPRIGQGCEHRQIPEQDLEQGRQIAHQFDIAAGDARKQPVRRQPAERDDKSDQGGEENADHRDQQRVEQTDQKNPRVGIRSGIRDQVLADVKSGRIGQEAEARGDPLRLQIGAGIGDDFVGDPGQHRHEQDLDDEAAPPRPSPKRTLQFGNKLRRRFSGFDGHRAARAVRSADRRRVLNAALVPELI